MEQKLLTDSLNSFFSDKNFYIKTFYHSSLYRFVCLGPTSLGYNLLLSGITDKSSLSLFYSYEELSELIRLGKSVCRYSSTVTIVF